MSFFWHPNQYTITTIQLNIHILSYSLDSKCGKIFRNWIKDIDTATKMIFFCVPIIILNTNQIKNQVGAVLYIYNTRLEIHLYVNNIISIFGLWYQIIHLNYKTDYIIKSLHRDYLTWRLNASVVTLHEAWRWCFFYFYFNPVFKR